MQDQPSRPALARFADLAHTLMRNAGTSYSGLARRTSLSQTAVSAAMKGHQAGRDALVTEATVKALDRALDAAGELTHLWKLALVEDVIYTHEVPLHAVGGLLFGGERALWKAEEVVPTDRRRLFGLGGLTAASVLAVTGGVTEELGAARPNISTLARAETALEVLDRDMWAKDPAVLFEPAFEAWRDVEQMLAGRVQLPYIPRLTVLAGQLAAGLSSVCRAGGDDRLSREFIGIAEEHAAAVGEPLLRARVAGLHSCVAFNAGQWSLAADTAEKALLVALPGQKARLAAYGARAAAAAGYTVRAEQLIGTMRAGKRAALQGPGTWNDGEEHVGFAEWAAKTPGAGRLAIEHGTAAVAAYTHDAVGTATAHVLVGHGHLDGDRPAPDAAAAAGLAALDATADVSNSTVHARVLGLLHDLHPWPTEPLVQELGRRVAAV